MDGFNYSMKAIPTTFAGVRMRSRLEARWASFFTNCGWRWTYEPFDTEGWAPDFTLHMPAGDIYIEVKPVITKHVLSIFREVAVPLVCGVGAKALLVSSSLDFVNGTADAALIGFGVDGSSSPSSLWPGPAQSDEDDIVIGCCGGHASGGLCPGGMVGMSNVNLGWSCWVCGRYDGNPAHDAVSAGVDVKWANSCKRSQWRG
jgi:hypothetical protein